MKLVTTRTAIAAFYLLLSTYSYAQVTPSSITHRADNFSIAYPLLWELNTEGGYGTKFFLFSPLTSSADQFRENINLIIEDVSKQNMTLADYTIASKQQIKNGMPDAEFLESNTLQAQGIDYQRIVYTATQQPYKLEFEQWYFIVKGQAYILTFTAETAQFKTYQKQAEEVLSTFKIVG